MIDKLSTGVEGLDDILQGGYPKSRPTLLKGGPGVGKTIFCQLFSCAQLANDSDIVFVTTDEVPDAIRQRINHYSKNGDDYITNNLTILDFRPSFEDEVVGNYELSAILLRIKSALEGKKNPSLVIDSLQNLLLGLPEKNHRRYLFKLLNWSRENNITTLITAAEGQDLDINTYEEYSVDCVIFLQQKIVDNLMTRYLRVMKLRESGHGTNGYPFALDSSGALLFPITSARISSINTKKRASFGIQGIDNMLGGQGYIEGSVATFSGSTGTGKTIFCATIAQHAAMSNKKVLYVSFEESQEDMFYNLQSASIDFAGLVSTNRLYYSYQRASEAGLEQHLINIFHLIKEQSPQIVIIDPITSLLDLGNKKEIKSTIIRFLSFVRERNITTILTELLNEIDDYRNINNIYSLIDTLFRLESIESNGETYRILKLLKSRGSTTSSQLKEFKITGEGIVIEDPYIGDGNIVFGTEKIQKIALDEAMDKLKRAELEEVDEKLKRLDEIYQSEKVLREIDYTSQKRELLNKKGALDSEKNGIKERRKMNKNLRGE